MKIKELEQRLNPGAILSITGAGLKKIAGDEYRMNPCPVCGHKDHLTIYGSTNSYVSFSGCTKGGGVYRYLIDINGLTEDEARAKLEEMAGYSSEIHDKKEIKAAPGKVESMTPEPQAEPLKDYTPLIERLYNAPLPETKSYFITRGIGQELIDKYKLSVFHDQDGRRAMLPIWKDGKAVCFTKRALDGQKPRYDNAAGQAPLFNLPELEAATEGEIIVITEGIFDALTIEETTGIKAVALGGDQHYRKAAEAIQAAKARGVIILTAFDNDDAGKAATKRAGLPVIEIPAEYKDINEWKLKAPAEAGKAIKTAIEQEKGNAIGDISSYLRSDFLTQMQENRTTPRLQTSIKPLDEALNGGLYPGLHIVGGEPGIGKTAIAMQIGDKIAEQGREVLYISLEMSKYELISRSLSRIAYSKGNDRSMLTGAILNGEVDDELTAVYLREYMLTVGNRLIIKQGDFNLKVADIKAEAAKIKAIKGRAPAIIVDYLQILQGSDTKKEIRLQVDDNVVELKRLSRDLNTPVILISSLSRNGQTNIAMSSFKESSGIEYSADTLTALVYDRQLVGDEPPKKYFDSNGYYPLEMMILKNRRGLKGAVIKLEWEPAYNYFHIPIRNLKTKTRI